MTTTLLHGDCREVLRTLPDCSVDSVVTDPPYELGFMGKQWDASGVAYSVDLWVEVLRVLKPGGHLLAFGGARTYHRMAVAIEDAGFEIRDSIHWIYGSGFPKSLDVSKAIDKAAGAEREVIGHKRGVGVAAQDNQFGGINRGAVGVKQVGVNVPVTAPATDAAKQWEGWGTALKPAHEPIVVARKPLAGTVAANVLEHGTGALNIDGTRVGSEGGRWPANIIFTHAAECQQIGTKTDAFNVVDGFRDYPQDSNFGARAQVTPKPQSVEVPVWACAEGCPVATLDQQHDGASRFFTVTEWSEIDVPFQYVAKPSKRERNAGLEKLKAKTAGEATDRKEGSDGLNSPGAGAGRTGGSKNHHPTVKPLSLMRWLVRLVTPPGGTVLEPFAGSGTTLMACILEGFNSIGIEMTDEYLPIIKNRVAWAEQQISTATDEQLAMF